ncbi:MAG: DUF364 domain-containing protein [Candidatus Wallbacteria bacterium]|nr:DUF364 domain-containing protein [Candidatus Wallbacteria bacterium]
MEKNSVFNILKQALHGAVIKHQLQDQPVVLSFAPLSPEQAIGAPEHQDYPILKGREVMLEAVIGNARGQAFTDCFVQGNTTAGALMELDCSDSGNRAIFVAGLNAVCSYLGLCRGTVHCRNREPVRCAEMLRAAPAEGKVLLVGLQPRLLEALAGRCELRVLDLDQDNIGKVIAGVTIENADKTENAVSWCDSMLVTGTVLVNGTISRFLDTGKPVVFYGVTIAAAAEILGLKRFCLMQEDIK